MKLQLVVFLLVCKVSFSQDWMGEIMVGASAYNGDLTQQAFSFKRINPAFGFSIKYNTGDFLNIRAGLAFEKVSANDKDNNSSFLKARNLNFKTNILEFDLSFEFVLLDPEIYDAYPYLFAGVGIFHFNPYTYDDGGAKTYLHPLSTEGQGLPDFGRKNYSLTQPCVPVGAGFKYKINKKFEASFEFGYRWLFTDYLDDVSKTYVSIETLNLRKGPKAAELSYRKVGVPFTEEGYPRGNPKVKDYYWFSGLKLAFKLNKK
jgi:hypothetical protein